MVMYGNGSGILVTVDTIEVLDTKVGARVTPN